MAFINAQLDADLSAIFSDLPLTVVIGGTSYDSTRSNLARDNILADEGLRKEFRFSIYLRAADIGTIPEVDTTVSISSVTYRIIATFTSEDMREYRLDLGEEYAIT